MEKLRSAARARSSVARGRPAAILRSIRRLPSPRAQKERIVIGRSGQKIHHPAQRIHSVQRRSRALQHLDRIHRFQRHRQIEIVVRSLRIVDAKSVEQHQRLLKAAAAQHHVGLPAARAALLKKNRGVLAQKILRRLGSQRLSLHRQNLHRARRLGQRHRRRRAQHHHGFRGPFHRRLRRRCGVLRKCRVQPGSDQQQESQATKSSSIENRFASADASPTDAVRFSRTILYHSE